MLWKIVNSSKIATTHNIQNNCGINLITIVIFLKCFFFCCNLLCSKRRVNFKFVFKENEFRFVLKIGIWIVSKIEFSKLFWKLNFVKLWKICRFSCTNWFRSFFFLYEENSKLLNSSILNAQNRFSRPVFFLVRGSICYLSTQSLTIHRLFLLHFDCSFG